MRAWSRVVRSVTYGALLSLALSGIALALDREGLSIEWILALGAAIGALVGPLVYSITQFAHRRRHGVLYGKVLDSVAAGDLTEEAMPDRTRRLGGEFLWKLRDMLINLRRVVGKVQSVSHRVKEVSTEVAVRAQHLMEVSRSQARSADSTFSAVEDMSESLETVGGNIAQMSDFAMDTARSLEEMLRSVKEVDRVLGELSDFVTESASAVEQMSASIAQVVANARQLGTFTEETGASVVAMDRDIASVERSAHEAADLSRDVAGRAVEGQRVVTAAVSGMSKIAESVAAAASTVGQLGQRSEEIGAIVGVISSIADQTNLLALNASIIAAQAGERGKGFAVVAGQIRALSERTRASTTEVAELIDNVQREVATAGDLMEQGNSRVSEGQRLGAEAERSLSEILGLADQTSEAMTSIAEATRRQSTVSGRITAATQRVTEMVAQVTTAASEQAHTSQEIARRAQLMDELSQKAKREMGEQASGSREIGQSMKRVTTLLDQVRTASQDLSLAGERIVGDMGEIQKETRTVSTSAAALTQSVEQLKLEAMLLEDEVHKFHLPVARKGGTLRVATVERDLVYTCQGLDPSHFTSVSQMEVGCAMYDGLVAWGEAMEVVPSLASSFEVAEDGRVYRFRLREGVRFHDGSPLEADDVRYSIERVLDPKHNSPNAWIFTDLEGAEAFTKGEAESVSGVVVLGPQDIELRLIGPRSFFLYELTMGGAYIVSRSGSTSEVQKTIGTGPFRLADYASGNRIVLERNEEYFLPDRPHLDRVEFVLDYRDRDHILEALRAGEIDVTLDLPASFRAEPGEEAGRINLLSAIQLSTHFFGFQCQTPPFDDVRVRQAIRLLMDPDGYIERRRGQTAVRASGILPPGLLGHDPGRPTAELDVPRARRLLEAAGITKGTKITFWNRSTDTGGEEDMNVLLAAFSQVGLELEVLEVAAKEFWQLMRQGRIPFFRSTWIADFPDPEMFLYFLCNSKAQSLYGIGYKNERVDELTERAREVLDPDVRAELYREAETIVLEEAPFIPINHDRAFAGHRPDVHGCQLYVTPPLLRVSEMWKAELPGSRRSD